MTDDLIDRRNEVRRYLKQRGIRVFPDRDYSNDPAQFCQEMAQDLLGCTLFVQLLSQLAGRRPPGAEKGFGHLQYQHALEKGLPIMQWYDPDLDLETVDNPDQRELLELETVKAMRIEEFKAELLSEIKRQIAPPPPPPPPPKVPPADKATLVFVNTLANLP